jgi:hypothetical protein
MPRSIFVPPLESDMRKKRRIVLVAAIVGVLIVLAGSSLLEFVDAISVLFEAAWDSSVLIVFLLAVVSYLVLALFKDPIGTATNFAALMLPIQEWEKGGAFTLWLRKQTWRIHVWLDYRKKFESGLHSNDQQKQIAALHRIVANPSNPNKKLAQIDSIRRHANPEVQSAARNMERIVTSEETHESPAVEPPAVEPPAVEPPAVEPPAVEPPAVEPPAVEPPAVEPPNDKPS